LRGNTQNPLLRTFVAAAALAAAYFAAAKFGLSLAFATQQVTAIWPPTGVALTALVLLGYRVWPGILAGAFLANVTTHEPLAVAAGIAASNSLTGLAGAWMLQRLQFDVQLRSSADVLSLAAVAMLSTLISAGFGTANLALGGILSWPAYWSVWWVWWVGDTLGILIVAPLLLAWIQNPSLRWRGAALAELCAYALILLITSAYVFARSRNDLIYPLNPRAYIAFPLLVWSALRFGQKETILSAVVICAFAIWGSIHNRGPFSEGSLDDRLLMLDTFIAAIGGTALLLSSVTAERRRAEDKFRALLEHAPDALVILDGNKRITLVNAQVERCFGYTRAELLGDSVEKLIPPTGHTAHSLSNPTHAGEPHSSELVSGIEVRAQRRDGRMFPAEINLSPLLTAQGELITVAIRDVSERHETQRRLRQAHDELEQRVLDRTAELVRKNEEKETLLKEIHHRVKNNLQVVCSLLNLQAHSSGDPRLADAFEDSKNRIRSIALVHEHLYQSSDLNRIAFDEYIRALVGGVALAQDAGRRIDCAVYASDITLPVNLAIPCGLIVNELVTNAFRHAFPSSRAGRVCVSIADRPNGEIELVVSDDGIGTPAQFDVRSAGFGLELVSMLVEQLRASLDLQPNPGATFRLRFSRDTVASDEGK
jgi:PAS domain S-box-containing protein